MRSRCVLGPFPGGGGGGGEGPGDEATSTVILAPSVFFSVGSFTNTGDV